jgi:hypothetical protein
MSGMSSEKLKPKFKIFKMSEIFFKKNVKNPNDLHFVF